MSRSGSDQYRRVVDAEDDEEALFQQQQQRSEDGGNDEGVLSSRDTATYRSSHDIADSQDLVVETMEDITGEETASLNPSPALAAGNRSRASSSRRTTTSYHRRNSEDGLTNRSVCSNRSRSISPHLGGDPGGFIMSSGSGDSQGITPRSELSSLYAPTGSFDLDGDSLEDDDVTKRYMIDFSPAPIAGGGDWNGITMGGASMHGLTATNGNGNQPRTLQYGYNNNSIPPWYKCNWPQWTWYSFQSARQRARQRRAQLLLQQSDASSWSQSTWICIQTSCDATDTGIALVLVFFLVWMIALLHASSATTPTVGSVTAIDIVNNEPTGENSTSSYWKILWLGMMGFAIRFGTRPTWDYLIRQRSKYRRHKFMAASTTQAGGRPGSGTSTTRGLSPQSYSDNNTDFPSEPQRTRSISNSNSIVELSESLPTTADGLLTISPTAEEDGLFLGISPTNSDQDPAIHRI